MIHFMENSIKESDKVLLIMTPTFKDKVEKREHGTGYEASIIHLKSFIIMTLKNSFLLKKKVKEISAHPIL